MKLIIVQWFPEESFYGKAMRVILSNHPIFCVGTRFDYGFMHIAIDEGYTIQILPIEKEENKGEKEC